MRRWGFGIVATIMLVGGMAIAAAAAQGRTAFAYEQFSDCTSADCDSHIVVVGSGGSSVLPCSTSTDGCWDAGPELSPDGRRIAHVAGDALSREIVIRNLGGAILQRFRVNASDLAWSPSGHELAYAGHGVGILDLRSGHVRHLPGPQRGRGSDAAYISWSSTDKLVWDAAATGGAHLFFSDPLFHHVTSVSARRDAEAPRWSPKGHRIAFTCHPGVCLSRADGSHQRVLSTQCTTGAVAWSPDGRRIACFARSCRLVELTIRTRQVRDNGQRACDAQDLSWARVP